MAKNTYGRYILSLVLVTLFTCLPQAAALADDARVAELEARVASLEHLVQQLLQGQASAVLDPADFEARVMEVAEERVAQVMEEHYQNGQADAKHSYKFGGYAKSNVIFSDYGGGSVAGGHVSRDFYIPGFIPVGGNAESYLDYQAKESRINFRSDHTLDNGKTLWTFVEVDFLSSVAGNERVSNSYNPRLRHAFFSYGNWLFGQSWTTLMNVGALPETLDFIGPSESTIFGRQAQIRYTKGPWQFALENPQTTITPHGGGSRISADTSKVPDAVLRYNHKNGNTTLTAAAILRQLAYKDTAAGIDNTTSGYGISLSGHTEFGASDDIRWSASTGKGLGRYIGLNAANGAVLDSHGSLKAIKSTGIFGAYHHHWNELWRSNLALGYLSVDNDPALTGTEVTKSASSLHLNLIYSPQPQLDFGIEYLYADRELENGQDGDLRRYQFTAKYAY